jgi:hypothetical protein
MNLPTYLNFLSTCFSNSMKHQACYNFILTLIFAAQAIIFALKISNGHSCHIRETGKVLGECPRVWRVLQKCLANVGESGESCEYVSLPVLAKVHLYRYVILCTKNIQSNLCTTATLGDTKKWPLFRGGRYSEVSKCDIFYQATAHDK